MRDQKGKTKGRETEEKLKEIKITGERHESNNKSDVARKEDVDKDRKQGTKTKKAASC